MVQMVGTLLVAAVHREVRVASSSSAVHLEVPEGSSACHLVGQVAADHLAREDSEEHRLRRLVGRFVEVRVAVVHRCPVEDLVAFVAPSPAAAVVVPKLAVVVAVDPAAAAAPPVGQCLVEHRIAPVAGAVVAGRLLLAVGCSLLLVVAAAVGLVDPTDHNRQHSHPLVGVAVGCRLVAVDPR